LHILLGSSSKVIPGEVADILSGLKVGAGSEGFALIGVVVLVMN
jgi:hypothetical protein